MTKAQKATKVAKTTKVTKTTKANVAKQKKVAERVMARKPGVPLEHSAADLKQDRGLSGVPPAARAGMIEITYAPSEDGPEQTVVDGVPFRAFEPVAIPVERSNMITTLSLNPDFTSGKLTPEQSKRLAIWKTKRGHANEMAVLQQNHQKQMAKLREGAGLTADGDRLPGKPNNNPPRTS